MRLRQRIAQLNQGTRIRAGSGALIAERSGNRRLTRRDTFGIAVVLAAMICGLSAASASASTCTHGSMTICLVTDGAPQTFGGPPNPLMLPNDIALEVSENVFSSSYPTSTTEGSVLVALQAAEFGSQEELSWTSLTPQADGLWHGVLNPLQGTTGSIPGDGLQSLRVRYTCPSTGGPERCGSVDTSLIFESLASVVNTSFKFRSKGRSFVSVLAFTNRVPVIAQLNTGIQVRRRGKLVDVPKFRREARAAIPLAPGRHEITTRIPLKGNERSCRFKQRCFIVLAGSVSDANGSGLAAITQRWIIEEPIRVAR